MAGRGNLSARLKLLKDQVEKHQDSGEDLAIPGGSAKTLVAANGVSLSPDWLKIGAYTYRRTIAYPNPLNPMQWASSFIPHLRSLKDLVFVDTETTGLSGGAGTVAFLMGFGRCNDDNGFEVTQLFMADYPGEPEYLNYIVEYLRPSDHLVSYNGSSFDLPLLTTRFRMNGLVFPVLKHIDLLYPTRRFWKTLLESCTLGVVEEHVLGVSRELDIPGAEVPERYFAFLRTSDPEGLVPVFAHHGQDIISLAALFYRLESVLRSPRGVFGDGHGIGRTMFELNISGWREVLADAFKQGNQSAGRYLSRQCKRLGEWETCVPIWRGMIGKEYGHWAAVELSKYLEHRKKDVRSALSVVVTLRESASGSQSFMADLSRRFERLSRKVAALDSD